MALRALLASPLGLVVGLSLGALGGGGSILAVPALVYGAGLSPQEATSASLLLVGLAAVVGLRPHVRRGNARVATGLAFGAAGVPGSLAGSALNHRIDPDQLLLGFSALILLAAWRMVTGCPTCTAVGEERAMARAGSGEPPAGGLAVRTQVGARRAAAIAGAGVAVGFLTGLFGVGGGFVIVPALTLLLRLSMPVAIGTSLVVIAINSAVGLAARVGGPGVPWATTIPFAVAAIAGVLAGGKVAARLEPERSLRWFAFLLVLVALGTATDAVVG